jgi:hypothetical protein
MKRIIEAQIRLIIGTLVMWFIGMLIFGANLEIYGIAFVIRMTFYVEGAFLIITGVGWPGQTIEAVKHILSVIVTTLKVELKPPMISLCDYVTQIKSIRNRVILDTKQDKALVNMIDEAIEVAETVQCRRRAYELSKEAAAEVFYQEVLETAFDFPKEVTSGVVYEDTYATTHTLANGKPKVISTVTMVAETVEELPVTE